MDTNSNSKNNETGLLFIGHGSRLPYNKQVVTELAEKYSASQPEYPMEVGFMELVRPSIADAFNKLKETGVKRVIVTPVFLAHGKHTKKDIPTILGIEPSDEELNPDEQAPAEHHHCNHGHEHHHGHHHHHAPAEPVEFDGEIVYNEPIGADDGLVKVLHDRIDKYL
ncbi:MAG: sirohydrochlorin nickelochelatase [Methanosphaera stadtmanae]|jgi:sirohydrochlorin cobaltochelatase|nr:sirohydrochlorin nickelochelatase [Methanosphaera stadtmanae]